MRAEKLAPKRGVVFKKGHPLQELRKRAEKLTPKEELAGKILAGLHAGLADWFAEAPQIDVDRVPALAEDREKLWAQVSSADFLSGAEKRATRQHDHAAGTRVQQDRRSDQLRGGQRSKATRRVEHHRDRRRDAQAKVPPAQRLVIFGISS